MSHLPISGKLVLLSVTERFTNPGVTSVEFEQGIIYVDQVVPIPRSVEDKRQKASAEHMLSEDESCIKLNKGDLDVTSFDKCTWPVLGFHMHHWENTKAHPHRYSLEPGETGTIQNFFFIPDNVQMVYIDSSVKNPAEAKSKKPIAWRTVTVYDLHEAQQKMLLSIGP